MWIYKALSEGKQTQKPYSFSSGEAFAFKTPLCPQHCLLPVSGISTISTGLSVSYLPPRFVRGAQAPSSVGQDKALYVSSLAPCDRHRVDLALHHFCWLATLGRGHSLPPGLGGVQPHCAVIPACAYTEQGIRLPCLHLLFSFYLPPPLLPPTPS